MVEYDEWCPIHDTVNKYGKCVECEKETVLHRINKMGKRDGAIYPSVLVKQFKEICKEGDSLTEDDVILVAKSQDRSCRACLQPFKQSTVHLDVIDGSRPVSVNNVQILCGLCKDERDYSVPNSQWLSYKSSEMVKDTLQYIFDEMCH